MSEKLKKLMNLLSNDETELLEDMIEVVSIELNRSGDIKLLEEETRLTVPEGKAKSIISCYRWIARECLINRNITSERARVRLSQRELGTLLGITKETARASI